MESYYSVSPVYIAEESLGNRLQWTVQHIREDGWLSAIGYYPSEEEALADYAIRTGQPAPDVKGSTHKLPS